MPTPKGLVEVSYAKDAGGWTAVITLPDGLPGELNWGRKVVPLHQGKQTIRLD
jgi:hypothetical protein